MSMANRIQGLRKAKGLSQEELADKMGVSRQAVSKWESEGSQPELDKVLLLSEFFAVTTDYILKGAEAEQPPAVQAVNAYIFLIAATALNFIGLIVSWALWYELQNSSALIGGLIFMVMGCMIFSIGFIYSNLNKEKALRLFWMLNIWCLAFILLSGLYNLLFSHLPAPYPLLWGYPLNLVLFPTFWLIYGGICVTVFVRARRRSKSAK